MEFIFLMPEFFRNDAAENIVSGNLPAAGFNPCSGIGTYDMVDGAISDRHICCCADQFKTMPVKIYSPDQIIPVRSYIIERVVHMTMKPKLFPLMKNN